MFLWRHIVDIRVTAVKVCNVFHRGGFYLKVNRQQKHLLQLSFLLLFIVIIITYWNKINKV